jgi:hypothetical protein
MDRSTTRLSLLATVLVWLASPALPAVARACDGAAANVIVIAVDDASPPPPAKPAKASRPPRSTHSRSAPAPQAAPATPEAPAVPDAPDAPAPPDVPDTRLEMPAPPAMITARGYFGFAFEVKNKNYRVRPARGDSGAVWRFYSQPRVSLVEVGSPAARGGLRRGDVITGLDGFPIVTPDAGRRFGSVQPGQTVRWTVNRDGEERQVIVTAGTRPGRMVYIDLQRELGRVSEIPDNEQMRREMAELRRQLERSAIRMQPMGPMQKLRYAGTIGESEVEVRGSDAVIVNSDGNEMIINIGNSVVKIRTPDAAARRKAETAKK